MPSSRCAKTRGVKGLEDKAFALFLQQVGDLTPAQFKALVKSYAGQSGQDARRVWETSVYAVSEQHLADLGVNRACPGCGSVAVVHNGLTEAGVQRFHCQDCGKSFTRFTGTLLEKSRYPWDVWVEVLKMTLADESLQDIKTVLERDFGCDGINIKTVFSMRMKLIHAMAAVEPPELHGVVQMDESFLRESQKGNNRVLVSYVKGLERVPRYGYHPSKLGTMGAEFAAILTAVDDRGFCVCKVVSLGKVLPGHVVDLYEQHCSSVTYLCSDANAIYGQACDLLDIPHYVRPSNYTKVIERAGYLRSESGKPSEERRQHNRRLLERLYRDGEIDYITHREDLTYAEFEKVKKKHGLSLARANELHKDIKRMLEKKMTNVATKYLPDYIGFFTFRRNWRMAHGHSPANREDAAVILGELLTGHVTLTRPELEKVKLTIPKPSGASAYILKMKTAAARRLTANKYFKFDAEDVPSFNTRNILKDAPMSRLKEIAKAHKIKNYTTMSRWNLTYAISRLPDIREIVVYLITRDRHYDIADEDIKYLTSLCYKRPGADEDA